jgi:hypothetical protein
MANDQLSRDPLAALVETLEPELDKVGATVEFKYSGPERGSLTINRDGKVMQTSYYASWELQALRDGGAGGLEKAKTAILDQINRLLNPPKPQPISLTSVAPARRGRGAAKKAAPTEAAEATDAGEATEGGDAPEAPAAEPAEGGEE